MVFFAATIFTLSLSGCTDVDNYLEQLILEKSGILEDEDYQQYQWLLEEGKLDQDGCYADPRFVEEDEISQETPEAQVHVTFADNRYLKVKYYKNADLTEEIDTTNCYLNAGDCIYASDAESINPNSNLYQLEEYRILEYDSDGNRKDEQFQSTADSDLVYQIPATYSGTDLSIIPIGEYQDRNLSMETYYTDDEGKQYTLQGAGIWSINGIECKDSTTYISSIESYILKYTYDKENYFYVGCDPKCFTDNPMEAGFIEFWEAEPTDDNIDYSIELHKYLSLSIQCDAEWTISLNQGEEETLKKNKIWDFNNLKYGDVITINTKGNCTITSGDYQHVKASKEPLANGTRYILKITKECEDNMANTLGESVSIDRTFNIILDDTCNYGECTYELDGKKVSGKIEARESQELTVTYKITDSDYTFAEEPEGIGGFLHSIFKDPEQTSTIPITADIDNTTIHADEWFDIVRKGD